MKKSLVFVLLVFCFTVFADTEIPAGDVSGNWDVAGSPYNVNGEIQIPAGDILTIDPGVTVNFTGHYKFYVYGTIEAVGAQGNEIIFTAANHVTGWHGLRFIDITTTGQAASQLVYCNLEYGRATGISPDYQGGAVYCSNSSDLTIQYCSFSDNSATTGGAFYLANSDILMEYVEVTGNQALGAAGAIYLNGSDITLSDAEITGNVSLYDGGGINCFNSDPVITRVIIAGNETQWNGGGISVFNNSAPLISKVTIVDNVALQNGSGIACLYNSTVSMNNSIIWDNQYNGIYVEPGTSFTATYSDIAFGSGQSYFGTGCIQQDPMFTNQAAGDYSLSWENAPTPDETMSPCIDSGNPESDPDPDGTVADMGAVYYPQTGVEGTVTLNGGSGVVSDVLISITLIAPPNTVYTTNPDAAGNYLVSLPSGTYNFTATLAGYSSFTQNNLEVSGELVTLDFTLTPPPPGEIVGEVDVEGIGDPTEVVVQAGSVSANPYAVYEQGTGVILYYEYTLELSPGTYNVTATLAGYETQTEEDVIVISGQQTTDIDFYLPLVLNEGTITGTVTLVGGAGDVQNVIISAGDESTSPEADGSYEITILNGTYNVTAEMDGYSTITHQDIVVTAFQATPDIDFDLVDGWEQISGTQYSMVVYATVTYDGAFMDNSGSNQLAAFGWDETGLVEECRGTATWIAGSHYFWNSPFALDGFWYITIVSDDNTGTENIWFDFYNSDSGIIEDCNQMVFFDDGTFDTGINLTIDSPQTDVTYDLVEGWNWVSFNRNPDDSSVDVVFDELDDVPDILQIKNQVAFAQYDEPSGMWVGALTNTAYNTTYKINMLNDHDDFTFTGEKYNPLLYSIQIEQGYNWISYLPDESLEIEEALQSITIPNNTCLKTQNRSAVYFGAWIGDMQVMQPGKGYLLSWPEEPEDPLFLTYPPASETSRIDLALDHFSNLDNWQLARGYESNMILMSKISAESILITDDQNYSVGVFDDNGVCRSIGKLQNEFWYFTIVGDVPELLELRLYNGFSHSTSTATESVLYEANAVIGSPDKLNQIDFKTGEIVPDTPQNLILKGNYPNPFNPSTMFSYALPNSGQVSLKVYNSKGQLVENLVDGFQNAGEYNMEWDAAAQSSGIYFYKLCFEDQQITRKCILMK